ncbi:hypothetical protein E2C01_023909 [Portunus trituberculatus]|uniref:Uncharacterized protein n=1 Tax=Portunus trituberculatus TaxID=210409 RepID=A0A5B7E963_PORTR|nr:hypothetical protein [Portunus trituberculatus]
MVTLKRLKIFHPHSDVPAWNPSSSLPPSRPHTKASSLTSPDVTFHLTPPATHDPIPWAGS